MKIAIFGATGRTGLELVKQGLEKGYAVTAFVRDPARLAVEDKKLSIVIGDVLDPASVDQAVKGQDAVIIALGGGADLKKTAVRAIGTINIISGMVKHKVNRLLAVTVMGAGESWDTLSRMNKIFFATVLKSARDDHEAQESAIKESGLDWTIVRPSGLQDGPRTGVYDYGEMIRAKNSTINRADVADLIIKDLEQKELIGKAVTITN